MAESVVKRVDDLFLDVIAARMRFDYRLPVGVGHIEITDA